MTLRYSITERPTMTQGDRKHRVLCAVRYDVRTTHQVYAAAYNPATARPERENRKTHGTLKNLQAMKLVEWRANFISITDAGIAALAYVDAERRAA